MSSRYHEDLKEIVLNQYNKKKEEYELSLRAGKVKPLDDGGIGLRSLPNVLLLEYVGFDTACRKQHHTEKFELGNGAQATPIYRRGDSFKMELIFNRTYNPERDSVFLILSFGPNASINKGTKYSLPLLPSKPEKKVDQWAVWVKEQFGNNLIVEIFTPANCLVGLWRFTYHVSSLKAREEESVEPTNIFYILFNPWCEDDEVYMEKETDREANIMCDYGSVFQGTHKDPTPKQWVYGQFDFAVIPSIFLLIERSSFSADRRGSAVLMARALSAVINANDDNGLLYGNWSGDFTGGTNPDEWTGSVGIFDRFLQDGGKQTVKFAQCWVFAGCLTTACRAIGIPCRSITCFNSAHDAEQNLTISCYVDQNGKELRDMSKTTNSIWNYHVWNEVWMKRLDLPEGYDGWQVIDATPQEKSRDLYRVGPTPIKAVLNGDLGLKYDVPFVFAEVNADICKFQTDPTSSWGFKLVQRVTNDVGVLIVTDTCMHGNLHSGAVHRETLTDRYKYQEGSGMERKVFNKAVKQMPKAQTLYEQAGALPQEKQDDVMLKITNIKSVIYGEQFVISVSVENYSSESRTIQIHMRALVSLYTGAHVSSIKEGLMHIYLHPEERKVVKVSTVSANEYSDKLGTANHIKISITGMVKETSQTFTINDTFEVIRPTLEVKVEDKVKVTSPFLVTFYFKNPFPAELTNCTLTIEAGQMRRPTVLAISNVPKNGVMNKTIELMPRRTGKCVIVGVFKSDPPTICDNPMMCDNPTFIRGSAAVDIQD